MKININSMSQVFKPSLLVFLAAILFAGDLFVTNAEVTNPDSPAINPVVTPDLVPLKKKKTKRNYYSLKAFNVTGDLNNSDASIISYAGSYTSNLYRRVDFPGASLSNIPPFRIYHKNTSVTGFEEESWTYYGTYLLTSGSLWIPYGYYFNPPAGQGTSSYHEGSTGDFRNFTFLGGTRKKKFKKMAFKTYDFNVSGDESNADATIVPTASSNTTYYYRKLAVPEVVLSNMPEYRVYKKNSFYSGFTDESWSPGGGFFFSNGYIWVYYGTKYQNQALSTSNAGDFRLVLYSDTKRKKKKIQKQFVKRYVFTVSGDENNADKTTSATFLGPSTVIYTYYRKVAIPGLKMTNVSNLNTFKTNSFYSGFSEESVTSYAPSRITDGYIWFAYGSKVVNTDTGAGTYTGADLSSYRTFIYN